MDHTSTSISNNGISKDTSHRVYVSPSDKVISFCRSIWRLLLLYIFECKLGYDALKAIFVAAPKIDITRKRSDQVCVMTGGTRGLGLEVVKLLLQLDYTVVLGARNTYAMQTAIDKIRQDGIVIGRVRILHLDLKSLQSVRTFAQGVLSLSETKRIHMLINNAAAFQLYPEFTEDGLETQFQVNYLSHFLLTNLLLPRIKETAKNLPDREFCHIVNTSSCAQSMASPQLKRLSGRKIYVPMDAYCDTKLYQVVHTKLIHRQLVNEGVTNVNMYAVHPGVIPTELWYPYWCRPLLGILKSFFKTEIDAANAILYPALSKDWREISGGKYFKVGDVVNPNTKADDIAVQRRLWDLSMELTSSS